MAAPKKTKPLWEKDALQFPRLLSEMYATLEFTDQQKRALCESMDLRWEDILELMERADAKWQKIKRRTDSRTL